MSTEKLHRDSWILSHKQTLFVDDEFYRYIPESGLWEIFPDAMIQREVSDVIEETPGGRLTNALANSVFGLVKKKMTRHRKRPFDKKPNLLACRNGTLDVHTRVPSPHKPENYLTSGVGFDYDAEATAPAWTQYLAYLDSVMPDVTPFLQEFAGLCVTTITRFEIALWLCGPPGCGKSTFIEGILAALKDRHCLLGLADLERSQFALTNLPGKTLAIATEQPSRALRVTHLLNAIISGEPITVERKYHHPITVTPNVKLLWAMNDTPEVTEASNGLFRRTSVLEFPALPEEDRDPTLKEKIGVEGNGILNWCLDGLERLLNRGKFIIPEEIQRASKAFRDSSDVEAKFVDECCLKKSDFSVLASTLYPVYISWCKETGHKQKDQTRLAKELKRMGFINYEIKGYRKWKGLKLKHEGVEG